MTTEQKTFDFTGVNAESNAQLIKNLEFNIALIEPKGHYHIDIPNELLESIAAIKQRLELYQGIRDYNDELQYDDSPRLIAYIIFKDATVLPIDSESSPEVADAEEVVWTIKNAISDGETHVKIGISTVNVNNVWQVQDEQTKERFTINEENDPQLIPISKETISDMSYQNLKETIDMMMDQLCQSEDDEDTVYSHEMLDHAIDELFQHFCNEACEHERTDNLLIDFISHFKLHDQFHQFLYELETQRENNDPYNVINEMYGDIDNFMKNHFLTKGGE
jgi:hypothetical protein